MKRFRSRRPRTGRTVSVPGAGTCSAVEALLRALACTAASYRITCQTQR